MFRRDASPTIGFAHPVTSKKGLGRSRPVPAFPEIDSAWEGYCLSHVHCVGMNRALQKPEDLLVYLHELAHWEMSSTLMNKAQQLNMILIYRDLSELMDGGVSGKLEIPVKPDYYGNSIERGIFKAIAYKMRMSVVDEVFAIWQHIRCNLPVALYSYHLIRDERLNDEVQRREREYLSYYNQSKVPYARDFAEVYDNFDTIASAAGLRAALLLTKEALCHPDPMKIWAWLYTPCLMAIGQGTPINEEYIAYYSILGRKTKDEERLGYSKADEIILAWIEEDWEAIGPEYRKNSEFFNNSSIYPYTTLFDKNGLTKVTDEKDFLSDDNVEILRHMMQEAGLSVGDPTMPPDSHEEYILLESIRQQLTQGIGLQCPFWDGHDCCGLNTDMEHIWNCASYRGRTPSSWQRRGCLKG